MSGIALESDFPGVDVSFGVVPKFEIFLGDFADFSDTTPLRSLLPVKVFATVSESDSLSVRLFLQTLQVYFGPPYLVYLINDDLAIPLQAWCKYAPQSVHCSGLTS